MFGTRLRKWKRLFGNSQINLIERICQGIQGLHDFAILEFRLGSGDAHLAATF